jgi:hypothetical protein
MEDVERLRSEDPKREFFFVVVGDNQNKYFKVKTRFFNQLFGRDSDSAYAGLKSSFPEGGATKKPVPKSTYKSTATETPPAQPTEGSTLKASDTGSVAASTHESRDDLIHAPSTAKATTSLVSTKPNPDIRTQTPNSVSTKPDAFAGTGKRSAPSNNATGRVAGEQFDAYRYDSALIAEWWNLREPDLRGSSQSADLKPLMNGLPSTAENSSIGAWCDEKPRIRHDGVRIDRIAPNGPADQAGLRIGDDILALDGIYLFTVEELMNKLPRYKPGTKVSLRYRRRSTIYDSFVILGAAETH